MRLICRHTAIVTLLCGLSAVTGWSEVARPTAPAPYALTHALALLHPPVTSAPQPQLARVESAEPFGNLINAVTRIGLKSRVLKVSYDQLHEIRLPMVALLWKGCYAGIDTSDPLKIQAWRDEDNRELTDEGLRAAYAGLVLVVSWQEAKLPTRATSGPNLHISWYWHDLGEMVQGRKYTAELILTNAGDSELAIANIRGTCGCTPVKLAKKTLTPGEQTPVTLELNTTGRIGKQDLSFYITSNDPVTPVAKVVLTGEIIAPKKPVYPSIVDFGTVQADATAFRRVTITNADGKAMGISKVTSDNACFVASIASDQQTAPVDQDLIISLTYDAAVGAQQGHVVVRTTDPASPELTIAVSAVVTPGRARKSYQLFLGKIASGHSFSREIEVALPDNRPFAIERIDCPDAALQITAVSTGDRTAARVTVRVTARHPVGPIAEKCQLVVHGIGGEAIPLEIYGQVVK